MNCYICKQRLNDGERVCEKCGTAQWSMPPQNLVENQYRYSEDRIYSFVNIEKMIDEEDFLISIGMGQGYQYYEAVIEGYKMSLSRDFTWIEQDAGHLRFIQWKKDSHEKYREEYAQIDNLLKDYSSLSEEINNIRQKNSIKWVFFNKDKAIEKIRTEQKLVKEQLLKIVHKIYG